MSLAAAYPLISVFVEEKDPRVCWIGSPNRLGNKVVLLHEVSTQAKWRRHRKFAFKSISRVDAGGGYEAALAEVAGPKPS